MLRARVMSASSRRGVKREGVGNGETGIINNQ